MSNSKSSGFSYFVGALTLIFVTLRLCDKITWSWWWVLSPLWITAGMVIFIIIVIAGVEAKQEVDEEKRGIFRPKSEGEWDRRLKEMKQKQDARKSDNTKGTD